VHRVSGSTTPRDNGALQNPTTAPKARVSYVANYPDALGRTVAVANYGTYGGAAWSRSATIPARSDDVLVSSSVFNAAGEQTESVDPMGTVMKSGFDQAGRQIKTIENYHAGTGSGPDINKTTRFEYNLDGNMVKLIAENPTTGDQVDGVDLRSHRSPRLIAQQQSPGVSKSISRQHRHHRPRDLHLQPAGPGHHDDGSGRNNPRLRL